MKEFLLKALKAVGQFVLGVLTLLGAAAIAAAEETEQRKSREREIDARNKVAEAIIVRRGDVNNLRQHVANIVAKSDHFWAPYEGKRLLKEEGEMDNDEYAKKLYNFVIEYGI